MHGMVDLDYSVSDELFKPKTPIKRQKLSPPLFVKKDKYVYRSIGAGVAGSQVITNHGTVNESAYQAQMPVMGVFNMTNPAMDETMFRASPPPGPGGPGTGELVPLDDGIPVLLLLLLGYCFWLRKRGLVENK